MSSKVFMPTQKSTAKVRINARYTNQKACTDERYQTVRNMVEGYTIPLKVMPSNFVNHGFCRTVRLPNRGTEYTTDAQVINPTKLNANHEGIAHHASIEAMTPVPTLTIQA